jgi:hypothetical protein
MYGSLMAPLVSLFRFYERVHELFSASWKMQSWLATDLVHFDSMYYYVV